MATVDEVLSDALKLSEKERARVAHELLLSLEDEEDPSAAEQWDKEIERRAREVLDGKVKGIPWEEVEARLRQKFRR
jgi:putative addiction module component (TIGR02574 family)